MASIHVSQEIEIDDFVSECANQGYSDELLGEIEVDVLVEYVATNHDYSVLEKIDEDQIVRFVEQSIPMDTLAAGLSDDDKAELRELLSQDQDHSAALDLTEEEWDAVKCGLKAILSLRNLIGGGAPGRAALEQSALDKINAFYQS